MSGPHDRSGIRGRIGAGRARWLVVVVLLVVSGAAATLVVVRPGPSNLAHIDPQAGMQDRSRWRIGMPPTAVQQTRQDALIHATRSAMRAIPDMEAARRAGWIGPSHHSEAPEGLEHWINPAYIDDRRILDPQRPESFVVRPSTGDVVGAMFISFGATPQPGPDAVWHRHRYGVMACYPSAGATFAKLGSKPEEVTNLRKPPCPAGFSAMDGTPYMIHVWLVSTAAGPFDPDMVFQGQDTSVRLD